MPELPEVQTVADDLRASGLIGLTFTGASLRWPRTLATPEAAALDAMIRGRRVMEIGRRAKYLRLDLDEGLTLLIHLRMTGKLDLCAAKAPPAPHDRLILDLSDGRQLRFNDTRKFGRVWLTLTPEVILDGLGVEPLSPDFTAARLAALLSSRARMLKPLLLDQSVVAGLGNIYVDEALWAAQLHPEALANALTFTQIAALREGIVAALQRGLRNMGTSLGTGAGNFYSVAHRRGRNADELRVFRRHGAPCPRCGAIIERVTLAGRGTHTCPACQPRPAAPAEDEHAPGADGG
ncbi:bifunctional DNA-formamidopyrimidine glycosylase/DNA-(apurinic or apyrimidinic site) lyase [Myxococcota bacterium]|nr:bifunctional DNA-formamidopyrimidine glycosylase/DNA-(apurinic or apyrimidinic site) lyase [Myxococcota bacterium]MBU1432202.1 bifunctional DNA-formamidopyrimidine glycosylase/DNA-(apurinic or apyrimidinic site) lyase [Myxococcota bacterium]MBU1900194.1 bifunctional DNA-formamidopyrimidine glycosylase/DNA-(apurinic or apyrimidinic site) lyase [Myxococcota bacterium]